MQKTECQQLKEFGERGRGCLIITSGLWLSWVMVPDGPWSLERGQGDPAGTWPHPALEAWWRIRCEFGGTRKFDVQRLRVQFNIA